MEDTHSGMALDSAAHDRGKELMHEGTPGRTRARDDESANQPGQVLLEFDDLELGAGVRGPDADFKQRLAVDRDAAGGDLKEDPDAVGSFGRTMFDTPASEDNTLTVVMHQGRIEIAPSQALLR